MCTSIDANVMQSAIEIITQTLTVNRMAAMNMFKRAWLTHHQQNGVKNRVFSTLADVLRLATPPINGAINGVEPPVVDSGEVTCSNWLCRLLNHHQ